MPTGNKWIKCYYDKIHTTGHGDVTPDEYRNYINALGLSDEEMMKWYAIDTDEYMVCIDAATGRTLWRTEFPGEGYNLFDHKGALTNNTGCIGDGRVYVFGALGIIRCLDAQTGKMLWSKNLPKYYNTMMYHKNRAYEKGDLGGGGRGNCNFINYIGGVVVGPTHLDESGICGLDGATGDSLWTIEEKVLGGKSGSLKWVHGGKEYIVTANGAGEIHSFEPRTGLQLWKKTGAANNAFQAVLDEDYLVVANSSTEGTSAVLRAIGLAQK